MRIEDLLHFADRKPGGNGNDELAFGQPVASPTGYVFENRRHMLRFDGQHHHAAAFKKRTVVMQNRDAVFFVQIIEPPHIDIGDADLGGRHQAGLYRRTDEGFSHVAGADKTDGVIEFSHGEIPSGGPCGNRRFFFYLWTIMVMCVNISHLNVTIN